LNAAEPPFVEPDAARWPLQETYFVQAQFGSGEARLILMAPHSLYETLATSGGATFRAPRIMAERMVVVGVQELRLHQLQQLGPDYVVLLRPDSACVLDPATGVYSKLVMVGQSGTIYVCRISEPQPMRLEYGGFMTSAAGPLDTGHIQVSLQVIVDARTCTVEDLGAFQPGAELPVQVVPGGPVQIAINGRVLGAGRLVQVNNRLGVQITGWY
jgi:flagellar motor switch/type III secretory pathway protein FliN